MHLLDLALSLGALAALASHTTASPAVVDRLVPYTEEDQARLRLSAPPIMDAHYMMPAVAPASCPTRIVPRIFPIMSINFTDATAYCSSLIATATSTSTLTYTRTAFVVPGSTTYPALPPPAKTNSHLKVIVHAGKHPMTSVRSACTCLVGAPTGPYIVTSTVMGPIETQTILK